MANKTLFMLALLALSVACNQSSDISSEGDSSKPEKEIKPVVADTETQIEVIRSRFNEIESNLSDYEQRLVVIEEDGSPYPLEINGYFRGENITKLVKSMVFGHTSQTLSCYFHADQLFFVFDEEYSEASVMGPFSIEEHRAYIAEDQLIRLLKKEATFEDGQEMNMSAVNNEEISVDLRQSLTRYRSSCSAALKTLEGQEPFTDGRWISTDDPKSGIQILNGKWAMFYDGTETTPEDFYTANRKIEIGENGESFDRLVLTNGNETLEYAILEHTESRLQLSFLPRGNTLNYRRE